MAQLSIEIPPDLALFLADTAAAQKKSIEQVAVERLRSLVATPGSPRDILQVVKELPPIDPAAVDEMEAEVRNSRIPVRDRGLFD